MVPEYWSICSIFKLLIYRNFPTQSSYVESGEFSGFAE